MTQPVVLELHPVRGWRAAGREQRLLVLSLPLVVLCFVATPGGLDGLVAVFPGWPACYAAARVLRPHVGQCAERVVRHSLAALSTSTGTLVLLGIAFDTDSPALWLLWWVPTLGLLITLPWALVAACVRAAQVPVAQPRTCPSPVTT